MKLLPMLVLALASTLCLNGQEAVPAASHISFRFEHIAPGVPVPRYTIDLRADGTGTYRAELPVSQSPDPQIIERPLVFSPTTIKTAFDTLQTLRSEEKPCASKLKNIADTGTKTLTYVDQQGSSACTYNYSENKGVVLLTTFFQAVEITMEEGRALDFKHRFDRLGLDAEMINLGTAVEASRAQELQNIASTLRSIAGDTELIQRVRLRAAKLLERASAGN